MKKKISPALSAVVIAITALVFGVIAWRYSAAFSPSSDVRPIIAYMNDGKPTTEVIPREVIERDTFMMGSKRSNSPQSGNIAKSAELSKRAPASTAK